MTTEMRPNTKLALLLTARWAVNGDRPLAAGEYVDLRRHLGGTNEAAQSLLDGSITLESLGSDPERLRGLLGRGFGVFQKLEKWLQAGLWVVSWSDPEYPQRFKQLKQRAPILVFGYGRPNAFGPRAVAIVGSRDASPERLAMASRIGNACAACAITVVSGGAKGVDSAAMEGGIENGGTSVGVLADSLLKGSGRRSYREAIQEGRLCLMSEVHPEARFDVGNAMARNRLAYACAEAALVIECEAGRGGTWAGALEALREDKHVYVLKGAKAESELVAKGAISIPLEFALEPTHLIQGQFPEPPQQESSRSRTLVGELAQRFPTLEALSTHLRSHAEAVASLCLEAAQADGLIGIAPAPSDMTSVPIVKRPRRRKKSNDSPEGDAGLFAQLLGET